MGWTRTDLDKGPEVGGNCSACASTPSLFDAVGGDEKTR